MKKNASPKMIEWAESIKATIHEYDKLSLWTKLSLDFHCYGNGFEPCFKMGFWACVAYRLGHFFSVHNLDFLGKIIQMFMYLVGVDISRKAVIGPRLCLFHPKGIFVGPDVMIGEHCNIGKGVFISAKEKNINSYFDFPIIGDSVTLAVGCFILGGVVLGNKVHISPNAVVIKDIEDNHTVLPPVHRVIRNFRRSPKKSTS